MATSAAPSCFIIRPYNARDKDAVMKVMNEATMSTVHRFSLIAIRRDVVAQSVLIVAAAIFILVDLPLYYSLITFPGTVAFIYLAVWLAHKGKIWTTHADLDKIGNYQLTLDPVVLVWYETLFYFQSMSINLRKGLASGWPRKNIPARSLEQSLSL